ncbi:Fatty acyl-CoA synthetase and RNA processing-associated kinase 1 [Smittium culicis]|uniref:Fatty acyl-CoA synthetase and RNA processing-associated kinase 1 n=1 Tax=Smittium culicis TaxID=133412 RepID=A0A1R1YRN3_9FUNG|nr:Fatty acyl-CoA synthetase and RNA processing-associated kinase 1 [Smittium culicis]
MTIKKTISLQDSYLSNNHTSKLSPPNNSAMSSKTKFFGNYLLLQTIGEGEFAKVKLGLHRNTGQEVAIKLVKKEWVDSKIKKAKIIREISSLKKVNHENIVRLYDIIESENHIGLVLEYASGGELFEYIMKNQYLRDSEAKRIFSQLILAVSFLHENEIVHRDLKLENILLDSKKNVKITDFGFANHFDEVHGELMITSCGSPCYAAPELVVSNGMYSGTNVDIWSCGVILFAMLAGYLPFDDDESNPNGENINLLYKYILSTELYYPTQVSKSAKSLLSRILVTDPKKRATMREIRQHHWLDQYKQLYERFDGTYRLTTINEGQSIISQKTKKIKLFFSQSSKTSDSSKTITNTKNSSKYSFRQKVNFPNSAPNSQQERAPFAVKSNASANGALGLFSKISSALASKLRKKELKNYQKDSSLTEEIEEDGSLNSEGNQQVPLMREHRVQNDKVSEEFKSRIIKADYYSAEPKIISWISKKLLLSENSESSDARPVNVACDQSRDQARAVGSYRQQIEPEHYENNCGTTRNQNLSEQNDAKKQQQCVTRMLLHKEERVQHFKRVVTSRRNDKIRRWWSG